MTMPMTSIISINSHYIFHDHAVAFPVQINALIKAKTVTIHMQGEQSVNIIHGYTDIKVRTVVHYRVRFFRFYSQAHWADYQYMITPSPSEQRGLRSLSYAFVENFQTGLCCSNFTDDISYHDLCVDSTVRQDCSF